MARPGQLRSIETQMKKGPRPTAFGRGPNDEKEDQAKCRRNSGGLTCQGTRFTLERIKMPESLGRGHSGQKLPAQSVRKRTDCTSRDLSGCGCSRNQRFAE